MANGLENIFSEGNMLSYSGACLDLAVEIPDHVKKPESRFDTLVIPSRGAVPFFLGMVYALDKLSSAYEGAHQEFYQGLGIQPMLTELIPENVRVSNNTQEAKFRILLAPFTADLNVKEFDSREDNDEYVQRTRQYWANVTAAFLRPPQTRRKDSFFQSFVDVILRGIEERGHIAEIYEAFPMIKRFAMIDTVISGRASNDILKTFDYLSHRYSTEDLKPQAFLVVDEDGKKLRRDFGSYLNRKKLQGQVRMYRVPRIVSEDESAALLGISAVIYPSIMRESKKLALCGEDFFVGAGSWFLGADLKNKGHYHETFRKFMELVYKGIDIRYAQSFLGTDPREELEIFRDQRKRFTEHAQKHKILLSDTPEVTSLGINHQLQVIAPYETRSHVIHIPFSSRSTEKVITMLKDIEGVGLKPQIDS